MPCSGSIGTLTTLISNRTLSVLFPMLSKTSLSTWPVGNGLGLRAEGNGEGTLPPKSRGIGGSTLAFVVAAALGDGGITSTSTDGGAITPFVGESCDATAVWLDDTLKKEDEPLGVALSVVPPDGRPGCSTPLLLSLDSSRSFPFSRFMPNESFDVFLTIEGR